MAYRTRIGEALYQNDSGTFATFHRDRDDKQVWTTYPTLEAAIQQRDSTRKQRAKHLETPKPIRDAQRLAELLDDTPKRDQWTAAVAEHDEREHDDPLWTPHPGTR